MRQRKTFFGWILFVVAVSSLIPTQFGHPTANAEGWPGYEVSPTLPVPRSWVTHWYTSAEYIALWAKGNPIPPLVTTSPIGTPLSDAGVLGEPSTDVLFGNERIASGGMQGGRLTVGRWLNECKSTAFEAEYWVAGIAQDGGSISTVIGETIVARPFFNTQNGMQDAQLVSYPGLEGSLQIDSRNEMHSVSLLMRKDWMRGPHGADIDLFVGYRYFRLRESLSIEETVGSTYGLEDKFVAENDFHGAEVGAEFEIRHGPWIMDINSQLAVGGMREKLTIDGSTHLLSDTSVSSPGGWLTAPSNIGRHSDSEFVVIPELDLRLVYAAFERIRLSVGYNMGFVSKVIRTGDQIDTTVNPGQLAPLPLARGGGSSSSAERPAPRLNDTALWFYGVTFGVEFRW